MDERDYKAMNAELKNQTAVEWLMEQLGVNEIVGTDYSGLIRIFAEAKEMEKQQIIDAVQSYAPEWIDAEKYYQETFKK
jgi:hypothetical protein